MLSLLVVGKQAENAARPQVRHVEPVVQAQPQAPALLHFVTAPAVVAQPQALALPHAVAAPAVVAPLQDPAPAIAHVAGFLTSEYGRSLARTRLPASAGNSQVLGIHMRN